MITTNGKVYIKRFSAGFVPAIAQSIAFGLGGKAEAVGDTKLQFETERADITLTSYDFVNDKLLFKASLPEQLDGTIFEVALYSMSVDAVAGEFSSKLISTFDSASEGWADASTGTPGTYASSVTRIGLDSLRHTPVASAFKTDALSEIFLNLSGHSGADKFVFAFSVGNAFTANVKFKFLTDAANYYEIALGAQTSGYKIVEAAKSSATVTGVPSWETINAIHVTTTSTVGGASQVDYEGIRIDDADTINPEYVMVSRELLSTPFVKESGMTQEVEFSLDVSA